MSASTDADVVSTPDGTPHDFVALVAELRSASLRAELELAELPAPQRLAPFAHAVAVTVHDPVTDLEIGSGRLVVLHDPAGVDSWSGTYRFVIFATCEVEGEIARDPLLPDVAWSWLIDALDGCGVDYTALGGTVTATSSARFGDIAGDERSDDVELRASWTAIGPPSLRHLAAFGALLAVAAGLPPEGVAAISPVRPTPKR